MAILILGCDAVFIHIPKTAGHWIEQTLRSNGVPVRLARATDDVHQKLTPHTHIADEAIITLRHRSCFVRKPKSWYESWYGFSTTPQSDRDMHTDPRPPDADDPWTPTRILPRVKDYFDFNAWMEVCMDQQPGFVTRMYEWYIGPPGLSHMDSVGRFEFLAEHLSKILKMSTIGINISAGKLNSVPAINISKPRKPPKWNEKTLSRMLKLEVPCYERFYGDNEHDLDPL